MNLVYFDDVETRSNRKIGGGDASNRNGTSDDLFLEYREFYILATLANNLQQSSVNIATIAGAISAQPIILVSLLKLKYSTSTLVPMLLLTVTFLEAMQFIVIFVGGWAGIYAESKALLNSYGRYIARSHSYAYKAGFTSKVKLKWMRRFVKSCQLIKIRFGSLNFIEELTPLTCLDFANNLTIQLLLLSK